MSDEASRPEVSRPDIWIVEQVTPFDHYHHGVTELLAYRRTRFQDMQVVVSGVHGKALVLDGKWQSTQSDEFVYHEALVQPAMISHGAPRKVLVLGGGEGATVREALRWHSVERVVMVDIDGEVVEACREHLPEMHQGAFEDPRTELVVGDALAYLDETDEQWDVIVSDLSDPIEDGPSFALFTRETMEKAHRVLAPGGRYVLQAGPTGPVDLRLHGRLVNTVASVFRHVVSYTAYAPTYGSPWGFAMAADEPLDTRPDPEVVDALLADATRGGLRLVDGRTLLGLLQTPKHIRDAIARETRVFTLEEPPVFRPGSD